MGAKINPWAICDEVEREMPDATPMEVMREVGVRMAELLRTPDPSLGDAFAVAWEKALAEKPPLEAGLRVEIHAAPNGRDGEFRMVPDGLPFK